jgi:NAD+ synthase
MLSLESLRIDADEISDKISDFIRNQVQEAVLKGAVISVSGGIDSAVALSLSVRALGPERVRAVTMPERDITPESDITDVMRLADMLDVTCDTVEITEVMRVMREILPLYDGSDLISTGNLKPRVRMTVAYHYANVLKSMVVGSSNRTEWLTGYFTKYGDGGVDIMPLVDLYKNQIRQLAVHLGIPDRIIRKKPSAGLWPGQTDEGELGISYDDLDLILFCRDRGMPEEETADELDIDQRLIHRVFQRVEANEHKRRLPTILRLRNYSS